MTGQNRRRGNRKMAEVKVDYRTVGSFITDYSRDISQGGIFISTKAPRPVGIAQCNVKAAIGNGGVRHVDDRRQGGYIPMPVGWSLCNGFWDRQGHSVLIKKPGHSRAFQGCSGDQVKSDAERLVKFLSVICVPSESLMMVEPALIVAEVMSAIV